MKDQSNIEQVGIDQGLLELDRPDVDPAVRDRILAAALFELEASQRSLSARLRWTYDWVLEPAFVIGLGLLYLGRAFQVVAIIKGLSP